MLSIALVFGGFGETVAAADTETDGPVSEAPNLTGTDHEATATPAESTETTGTPVVVETVPTVLKTPDAGTLLGTEHEVASAEETNRAATEEKPAGLTGPMALGVTTVSQTSTEAPATAPETTTVTNDNKGSDTVPADATVQDVKEPETAVSYSPVTAPSPEPQAPGTDPTPPSADPPAQEPPAAQLVTNTVAPTDNPPPRAEAAPPVVGPAAAGNLIAVLAYLFITGPAEHASLGALPAGLLSLLGFPLTGEVGAAPVAAGRIGGSLLAGGMPTVARAALASALSMQSTWPEMLIASAGSHASAPATRLLNEALHGVSTNGVRHERLSVAMADSIVPEQVRAVLRHTVGAVLAPLSLLLLALMASPGVAGLVLLGAAGTFVGYRQARAASILRAVGIARFVKAGPLGVVRSGGLVAVHSRRLGADRRQSQLSVASLDHVA